MQINIRSLQHYLYCPHRWGLIEIGKIWAENMFVARGNLMHERVHDANLRTYQKGSKQIRGVTVFHDELGIYGVVDCLELKKAVDGACIDGEKYKIKIIEYKPRKPKNQEYNMEDAIQVFAQMLCLRNIYNIEIECEIYYVLEKTRVKLPFVEKYEEFMNIFEEALFDIRKFMKVEEIPNIRKNQRCVGCSLKDLCMPKIKKQSSIQSQIMDMIGEMQ